MSEKTHTILSIHPGDAVTGSTKSWVLFVEAARTRFTVWTSTPQPKRPRRINQDYRHDLPCPQISRRLLGNLHYFLSFPFFVLRYIILCNRYDIDIVHCNGIYLWQPMMAAKLCGRKLITHVREDKDKYPFLLYKAWIFYCSLLSDKIICVSARDKENFSREDVIYIPNWISVEQFEDHYSCASSVTEDFKDNGHEDSVKFVVVSQIIDGKGQDFAIDILKELKSQKVNACLYLAGGTNDNPNNNLYRDRLYAQVERLKLKKDVIFLGPKRNVLALMKNFDFCIMPSRSESFSRVHLEAMYSRCPLIATDVGSTSKLIKDMLNGIIIQPGDVKGTVDKIQKIISDKILVRKITENAYRTIIDTYTGSRFTKLTTGILIELLPGK